MQRLNHFFQEIFGLISVFDDWTFKFSENSDSNYSLHLIISLPPNNFNRDFIEILTAGNYFDQKCTLLEGRQENVSQIQSKNDKLSIGDDIELFHQNLNDSISIGGDQTDSTSEYETVDNNFVLIHCLRSSCTISISHNSLELFHSIYHFITFFSAALFFIFHPLTFSDSIFEIFGEIFLRYLIFRFLDLSKYVPKFLSMNRHWMTALYKIISIVYIEKLKASRKDTWGFCKYFLKHIVLFANFFFILCCLFIFIVLIYLYYALLKL